MVILRKISLSFLLKLFQFFFIFSVQDLFAFSPLLFHADAAPSEFALRHSCDLAVEVDNSGVAFAGVDVVAVSNTEPLELSLDRHTSFKKELSEDALEDAFIDEFLPVTLKSPLAICIPLQSLLSLALTEAQTLSV